VRVSLVVRLGGCDRRHRAASRSERLFFASHGIIFHEVLQRLVAWFPVVFHGLPWRGVLAACVSLRIRLFFCCVGIVSRQASPWRWLSVRLRRGVPPRCRGHGATVTVPRSRCRGHGATVTVPQSRCRRSGAAVAVSRSRCRRYGATVAVSRSRCRGYGAAVTVSPSLRSGRYCRAAQCVTVAVPRRVTAERVAVTVPRWQVAVAVPHRRVTAAGSL